MRPQLASLLVLLLAAPAWAQTDGRIAFLSRQLGKASDARVRSQAALMLGASQDAEALQPLCEGLKDASDVVRAAAARGLGELGDVRGLDCLKGRTESSAATRTAIEKAIAVLDAIRNRKPEYYVQLLPVADKTQALAPDLIQLTEDRLKAKLSTLGTMFAPAKETKAAAKSVIKSKKLKGYALKVELHPGPSNGLKLQVLCFTYPEQSLLGEVNVKASGAKAADLIRALAPKAIEEAVETFDWRS